ncbi:MAG: hypothetical protein CSA64_03130 [Arachnia propionica]|nr:MAG: hypothetical protein CSA64_03130 [Arachnia propionica]
MSQEQTDNAGLGLFEDASSAAGGFPTAMFGYDRHAVDTFVRELEAKLVQHRADLREQSLRLDHVRRESGETEYGKLGAQAKALLVAAEQQGLDIIRKAEGEAERVKGEGRRSAAALREAAQREADEVRLSGLSALRKLRQEQAEAGRQSLENAKRDAHLITADAETKATVRLQTAEQQAASMLEAAKAQAAQIVQEAVQQAAERSEEVERQATARTEQLAELASQTEQRIAAQLESAENNQREAANNVAAARVEAGQIRSEAVAAAEQLRVGAAREAEETIAAMRATISEAETAVEERLAWRREQLEREIAALETKRSAIMATMANLRELASEGIEADTEPTQVLDPGGSTDD